MQKKFMASFFHTLRDDFPDYLDDASGLGSELPLWHRLASVGFSLSSEALLDLADTNFIESSLRRFPPETALQGFAALAMGVLMGKLAESELSEIDMVCLRDDLHGFVEENRAILCARFGEARV